MATEWLHLDLRNMAQKYPRCNGCGLKERPRRAYYSRIANPTWYCDSCHGWKECKECRSEKPRENFSLTKRQIHERCLQCEYPTCCECGTRATTLVRQQEKEPDQTFICSTCNFPPCSGCGRRKRPNRRENKKRKMPDWFCSSKTCQAKKRAG